MLHTDAPLFALAGLAAASGPIIIHLLHRRRFRQVHWAAMDFLRQALQRRRRPLQLRDLLLLALRVLCVILFGFALARPYYRGSLTDAAWHAVGLAVGVATLFAAVLWGVIVASNRRQRLAASGVAAVAGLFSIFLGVGALRSRAEEIVADAGSRRQPVHAILLIDNSRSMGTENVGMTLLERAQQRAQEFVAALPADSRTTVIPLAGSDEPVTLEAHRHRDEAERAIDRIPLSDASENLHRGLELAVDAARQVTELPAKRVVLLTDLQRSSFRDVAWGDLLEPLGGLQIAPVAVEPPSNLWVSDFHLEDGLASGEAPARFLARVEAAGGMAPVAVLLRLSINGVEVASQTIEISPGQSRDVSFTYQFEEIVDPARPIFVAADLQLQSAAPAADQLISDNRRTLIVPVAAALPVVFVDEYGDNEDLSKGRIGETYVLRHLLAPKTAREFAQRRLIRVIHVRQDELTEDLLRDARLVVIAGVERPDACVSQLREYVWQGGPLVILAGGQFDPLAWQELAWRDGAGILPAPLKSEMFRATPAEDPQRLQPFFAAFESMDHDYFLIEQEDPAHLAAIYNTTPFFKAVVADVGPESLARILESETERFTAEKSFLEEYAARQKKLAARDAVDVHNATAAGDADDQRFRQLEPAWWRWRSPSSLIDRSTAPRELGQRQLPRVLAEFRGNHLPFVVDRKIGAGQVVLFTSSVTSDWNLLRTSGAMYLFHRLFSALIEQTLPVQNYEAGQRIVLPVEHAPEVVYQLTRPSGRQETLPLESSTLDISGVRIPAPIQAGHYRLRAEQRPATGISDERASETKISEWIFGVNGPLIESDLTRIAPEQLTAEVGRDDVQILATDETIHLASGARRGQSLWEWLLWGVFCGLLGEMALLSKPRWSQQEAVS